jgi:hypothetical protein
LKISRAPFKEGTSEDLFEESKLKKKTSSKSKNLWNEIWRY